MSKKLKIENVEKLKIENLELPDGWVMKKLSELCKTGAGGTPLKSHKDYYINGNIPWLRSGEVNTKNITKSELFITEKGLKNSSAKLFPKNSVLVAMYGATAGQVGILRFESSTNQAVCGILPNEKIIPEFIYYKFLEGKEDLVKQAVGGAQPNISQIKIKNTLIPNISLPQQKQIVALLDKAFAAIDGAKANAEQNLANAQELFESYLQKVFENKGEDWEEKTLGEVCKVIGGGTPSKKREDFYTGNILWVTVRDMKSELIKNTTHKITLDAVKNSSTNIIPKGNVIIATRVGLGKVCLLEYDSAINQDLKGIIPKDKKSLLIPFLFRWFTAISTKIINAGTGATVQGVKLTFINSLSIPLPSLKEQQKIVKKLDALSAQTKKLETIYRQKIANLEELKKSVLQKAFNGELTVKN